MPHPERQRRPEAPCTSLVPFSVWRKEPHRRGRSRQRENKMKFYNQVRGRKSGARALRAGEGWAGRRPGKGAALFPLAFLGPYGLWGMGLCPMPRKLLKKLDQNFQVLPFGSLLRSLRRRIPRKKGGKKP